ncbi:MAG TPA: hypothetical protein VE666_05165, partial [Mycobacterium sp.]|nr:hypothetical protein [Mycobacterium sp.]
MDISFPPELQWVSYLAGGAWPQGSESGMGRISEHFAAAASELQDLIPDLNSVRSETLSVLAGDTANAAADQFAMLFDGDYAVDKLAKGTLALGDGAQSLGVEIEYSKLSIIVGLALAAVEISWCLANAGPTMGASTAAIPGIEWATVTSIRRLVAAVLERVTTKLAQMIEHTTIKDLIKEGTKEAFQELGQGLAQEGIAQGIQVSKGTAGWRPDLFRQNAIASFVGGAAGGGTALPVAHGLGPSATRFGRAAKGVTTMFTAGIAGNVAGTASVGGEFDTVAVLAGSAASSVGGAKGLGHGRHEGNESSTGTQTDDPSGTGDPPRVDPADLGSLDHDEEAAAPKLDESSVDGDQHSGQPPPSVSSARVSASSSGESTAGRLNNVAARSDSSTRSPAATTDHHQGEQDAEPDAQPSTPHPGDTDEPPTHSSDETASSDTHTAKNPQSDHQTTSFVTAEHHPPSTQDGQPPANPTSAQPATHASAVASGPESRIEPASGHAGPSPIDTASDTHAAAAAPATPAAPAANPAQAPVQQPSTPAATASVVHTTASTTVNSATSTPSETTST